MRKAKAVAVAVSKEHPLSLAVTSAYNTVEAIGHFMYGTKERSRATFWFAIALSVVGAGLNLYSKSTGCAI